MPANPLQEVPFLKQPALLVKAFVGNKLYVPNTGDKDVTITSGTFLYGYGKGKFSANNNGSFNPDCHHMYHIKTCDDFVFTTKMTTMKKVVAEHRANNWEAKIAFHSMFDIASTDKDAFGVKLEREVFFIPAFTSDEEGGQSQPISQATLAGKLPANIRELTLRRADMGPQVGPQGLGPVRPLVLFKQACDLPAGMAVSLM